MILPLILTGGLVAAVPERPLSGEPFWTARADHAAGSRSRDGSGDIRVVDGDTLRIGNERIRLIAIDACETRGKQRRPDCTREKGEAAAANMRRLLTGPAVIERVNKDRYGRTIAVVHVNGMNLSCAQIRSGHAVYVARYDVGGRVKRECGL